MSQFGEFAWHYGFLGYWLNKLIRGWSNDNVNWEAWDQTQVGEMNVALWGQFDCPVARSKSDRKEQWDITHPVNTVQRVRGVTWQHICLSACLSDCRSLCLWVVTHMNEHSIHENGVRQILSYREHKCIILVSVDQSPSQTVSEMKSKEKDGKDWVNKGNAD